MIPDGQLLGHMHLAEVSRLIAVLSEHLGEDQWRRFKAVVGPDRFVVIDPGLLRIETCENAGTRGHTDGRIAETVVESDAVVGYGVNVGCLHRSMGIAVAAERVGTQLVTIDPEYIRFFHGYPLMPVSTMPRTK